MYESAQKNTFLDLEQSYPFESYTDDKQDINSFKQKATEFIPQP